MLGNITQNTGSTSNRKEVEDLTNSKLKDLTQRVSVLENEMDNLDDEVITEKVISDTVQVNKNLSSPDITATNVTSSTLDTGTITSENATISKIESTTVDTTHLDAIDIKGQILDTQDTVTAKTVNATTTNTTDLNVSGTASFSSTTFTGTQNIPTIESDMISTKAIVATETTELSSLSVNAGTNLHDVIVEGNTTLLQPTTATSITADSIDTTALDTDAALAKTLEVDKYVKAPKYYGRDSITLPTALLVDGTDYYLIKIRKHDNSNHYYDIDNISLEIKDNFAIKFLTAYGSANDDYVDPETGDKVLGTKGTTLVLLHQKSRRKVFLVSEDADYFYFETKCLNDDGTPCEIKYSYTSNEGLIDSIVEYEYNTHPDYDWYYQTQTTAEMIMLGDKSSNYQFTVLGKLKATIEMPETTEFDNLQVNHCIYTRTTYNDTTDSWNYKKNYDNQYLSSVNEYYDEDIGDWVTHIEWKSPVNNEELGNIELTDDIITEYQEPIESGESVEYRDIQSVELGTRNKLITLQTLGNYNGKVKTSTSEKQITIDEKTPTFNDVEVSSGTSNVSMYMIWNGLWKYGHSMDDFQNWLTLYGIDTEHEIGYTWDNLTAQDNHYMAVMHNIWNQAKLKLTVTGVSTFTIEKGTKFSVTFTSEEVDSDDNAIYTFTVTYGTKTFALKTGLNSTGDITLGTRIVDQYISVYSDAIFYGKITRDYDALGLKKNKTVVMLYDTNGTFIKENAYIPWQGDSIDYKLSSDLEVEDLDYITDTINIDFTKGYTYLGDLCAYRASNNIDPLTSDDTLNLLVDTTVTELGTEITSSTFMFNGFDTYAQENITCGGETYQSHNTKICWGEIHNVETDEYNPITKLGTVDEGSWEAGDIIAPNVEVEDELTIDKSTINWHNTQYEVWNDGSSSSLDLDWVNI